MVMTEALWFYSDGTDRDGPIPESVMHQLLRFGTLEADTLVWTAGMSMWQPASEVYPILPSTLIVLLDSVFSVDHPPEQSKKAVVHTMLEISHPMKELPIDFKQDSLEFQSSKNLPAAITLLDMSPGDSITAVQTWRAARVVSPTIP